MKSILLLSSLFVLIFALPPKEPELPQLNVHIIAHTHDDVGWLKTVDEYFYGANSSIQDAGVQYILDGTINALVADPTKKFIYVEIAFFERWWAQQTEYRKEQVRELVSQGRFEFINGGIVMNDEACTHYSAIVDQMSRGHEFIFREFGVRPRVGWHIDPFGHAATQASLFAQMGFDGFFFGRIEYTEHNLRNESKELEFVWRGSESLGSNTQIFTHVLYTDYCYLPGFAFEYGDTPIQDDPNLFDMNVEERCDTFAALVRQRSNSYLTPNILVPFGCDFRYENAIINFKNIDKMIKYINTHPQYGLNLFYSTPSIYLDAVYQTGLTWEVRTGDFFPYADAPHAYWTGYYTSRSGIKGYVRDANNFLHATDKLFVTAGLENINNTDYFNRIDALTQAYSIAQHHDAVSGTEQQHVANDYAKRLYIGMESSEGVVSDVLGALVSGNSGNAPVFTFCPLNNVSVCPATSGLSQGQVIPVVIYNHLGWENNDYVRIAVPTANVEVTDDQDNVVAAQIYPSEDLPKVWTLVFPVEIPAVGFRTYFLQPSSRSRFTTITKAKPTEDGQDITIQNEFYSLTFSGKTNKLASITNKLIQQTLTVTQDILWYNESAGNNADQQASGAYIFRPNGTDPFPVTKANPTITTNLGPLVQEVYQVWNDWASMVTRLYTGTHRIEVEFNIGPVDISDGLGKEVISRWSTSLNTNELWYCDSEGQEFMQRRLNWRPWNQTVTEPIASNYYPMNTAGYINDLTAQLQFSVITDRSRACSSLSEGEFENVVFRRLLYDDGRGVSEPLNESQPIRTTEVLHFDSTVNASKSVRTSMLFHNNPLILSFSTASSSSKWIQNYQTSFAPMTGSLPDNVHMLNLRTMQDGTVVLRLHHLYAVGEDEKLSQPVQIDLDELFNNLSIVTLTEMTLTANRPINELHRLQWKTNSFEQHFPEYKPMGTDHVITLNPMDIRTFIVRFQNLN